MTQIRSNQIIPSKELNKNPYIAPPRDLRLNTKEHNGSSSNIPTRNTGEQNDGGPLTVPVDPGLIDYGDSLSDASQLPATPAIIGIKQQIVVINDDGSTTIDVILNVQDIKGVTEYDIRVAKDAGNL